MELLGWIVAVFLLNALLLALGGWWLKERIDGVMNVINLQIVPQLHQHKQPQPPPQVSS